jgi:hypothetical protein
LGTQLLWLLELAVVVPRTCCCGSSNLLLWFLEPCCCGSLRLKNWLAGRLVVVPGWTQRRTGRCVSFRAPVEIAVLARSLALANAITAISTCPAAVSASRTGSLGFLPGELSAQGCGVPCRRQRVPHRLLGVPPWRAECPRLRCALPAVSASRTCCLGFLPGRAECPRLRRALPPSARRAQAAWGSSLDSKLEEPQQQARGTTTASSRNHKGKFEEPQGQVRPTRG